MRTIVSAFVCYICVTVSGFAIPTNCVAPPSGLVLWLPFDEGIGSITANLAATGNPGILTNNPNHGAGYVRNGLCFSGNSGVYVPDYAGIDIGTGDFTIDAWVSTSGAGPQTIIIDKRNQATGIGYALWLNNQNLVLELTDSSHAADFNDTANFPTDGQWHLVAVTISRTSSTGGAFLY